MEFMKDQFLTGSFPYFQPSENWFKHNLYHILLTIMTPAFCQQKQHFPFYHLKFWLNLTGSRMWKYFF